ncbi:hypothetical protein JVT61DRAFT_1179 [Boletus reticuloceps]|uniref:Homeobox domain-containing protein n=1 Tax=Boletus reticuloceps TaxID=495285 RepID=A0A8I2YUA2_9AGAM|nr:hypothetical protein JVT61DRAFT_1179 [Boletus reticuloceps]
MDVEGSHPSQRRRPTIATEWQLAVLKKLQSESGNPTEEQRSAAAAETGLCVAALTVMQAYPSPFSSDKKWVRKWFTRQRSKLAAARNRTTQQATTATFKLYSTPDHPPPYLPSPASLESPSPPSTLDTQAIPHAHRTVLVPMPTNNSSQNTTLVPHTTTIPTYSRDPLCSRYPDFSQFFRPTVHERFHTFDLSDPVSHLIQPAVHPCLASHAPIDLLDPLRLGGLFIHQSPWTNLYPCPVAFSTRLADLLGHASLARYPIFPLPEPGYRVFSFPVIL